VVLTLFCGHSPAILLVCSYFLINKIQAQDDVLLLLQETLREFGIVFWCHHKMRFNSSNINALRARAEAVGLVAWPVHPYPTSTYTHDGMFRYFGAVRHNFHFHRMVEPDAALYVNTYRLHHRLLRPWVSCALDPGCLAPPGAQASEIL